MHNNAEFLSRFSSNAYEFDKSEMHFHLRKSVVTFAKNIYIYIFKVARLDFLGLIPPKFEH